MNKSVILVSTVVLILVIIMLHEQNKKINGLSLALNQVGQKADQSNMAARVALQHATELAQDFNRSEAEASHREPIGFKFSSEIET